MKNKLEPYKNARNFTAGTLKLLDPKEAAKRKMSFFAYGTGAIDGVAIKSQAELFETLKSFGFPVNPHTKLCTSMDEVIAFCNEWDKKRASLPYDTDGMVIKVNDFAQRERLGFTSKVPRWAKAYKFEAEQATTKLGEVEFSLGKFGELTPVAQVQPAGATGGHDRDLREHAQRVVGRGEGRARRRHGRRREERRDHSAGRRRRQGRADREREGHSLAEDVPEVRRAGREAGDRDELQLRLHEHRRSARRSSRSASRASPGARAWTSTASARRSRFNSSIPNW